MKYLSYFGKHVCSDCLYKIFRKRVRRLISSFNLLDGEGRIGIIFDESPTSMVSIFFLREMCPEIELLKISNYELEDGFKTIEKIVDPKCLEDFGEFFLERLAEGKFEFLEVREGKIVRPFIGVPEDEIEILLRRKYKYRGRLRKVRRKYAQFLREVEGARSGSLFSLLKLYMKLRLIKA